MAALAQMEHEIKRERVTDSISKRREAGGDLGGRPRRVTDSQIRSALRLVEGGEPAAQVARDLGMSRATFYRRSRALANQQDGIWRCEKAANTAAFTRRSPSYHEGSLCLLRYRRVRDLDSAGVSCDERSHP
jgi:DNA invertase Pin-like site-specific DNA recombinase